MSLTEGPVAIRWQSPVWDASRSSEFSTSKSWPSIDIRFRNPCESRSMDTPCHKRSLCRNALEWDQRYTSLKNVLDRRCAGLGHAYSCTTDISLATDCDGLIWSTEIIERTTPEMRRGNEAPDWVTTSLIKRHSPRVTVRPTTVTPCYQFIKVRLIIKGTIVMIYPRWRAIGSSKWPA